ncbi:MAG: hypothetical protein M0017_03370 [Desulfobacteraceae bacterium]|nr:hypothetical protein [Desulfobacteraceae bacterium]
MRFGLLAVTTTLFSACLAIPGLARADYIDSLEVGIDTGYRVDDLDFNIAGSNGNPNILSELTWKDLEIYEVGGSGKMTVGNDYFDFLTYLRGSINYGWILNGENQDSDYLGNNRTGEYSRIITDTKDDNVFDASIGIGLQWKFFQDRLAVAPLGGYSYHQQNLRDRNGAFVIPALGPFTGLDSTYQTEWQGPWAGIDIEVDPIPQFSILGTFEYHWADYDAEANWNLRPDLAHPVSFRHDANDADGIVVKVTGRYALTNRWGVELSYAYQDWQATNGTDTTYGAGGGIGTTTLNEVNWKSETTSLGLSYKFF